MLYPSSQLSIDFRAYVANATNIVFSIQAPDGTYLVKGVSTSSYSYVFTAFQSGSFVFNFSDPKPAAGFTAANITKWYNPSGGNQVVPLQ